MPDYCNENEEVTIRKPKKKGGKYFFIYIEPTRTVNLNQHTYKQHNSAFLPNNEVSYPLLLDVTLDIN